ncbi:unnamed protein product [Lymnaea stagnalis]|uniref:PHD-type domain-containing protein n=1 Tax=Lymnaea stagnalis TaxID=6523 RepID=A0AAV2I6C7_LYMST
MLLSGCLFDSNVLPPFSILQLKTSENIFSLFANETISLSSLQPLFTEDAWEILEARIAEKKGKDLCYCNFCFIMDDSQYKMIECEGCLEWFHYHCFGLRTTTKPKKWYCEGCWL